MGNPKLTISPISISVRPESQRQVIINHFNKYDGGSMNLLLILVYVKHSLVVR